LADPDWRMVYEMKRLLAAFIIIFSSTSANAQCNGAFGANTVCGSFAGGLPSAIAKGLFSAPVSVNVASTIASGASATLDDINIETATTTVTGTTNITTPKGFNKFSVYQPTFTDSSAATITTAATLYIDNAPTCTGSLTCTNAWTLNTGAGEIFHQGSNETGNLTDGIGLARNSLVNIKRNITSLSQVSYGVLIDLINNNTTANEAVRGQHVTVSTPNTNSTAQGSLIGNESTIQFAGTSTSTGLVSYNSAINVLAGTGTVNHVYGMNVSIENLGSTIGVTDGLYILTPIGPTTATAATWTELNGIEIADQNPTVSGGGSNSFGTPPVGILIDKQTATGAFAIETGGGDLFFQGANETAYIVDGQGNNRNATLNVQRIVTSLNVGGLAGNPLGMLIDLQINNSTGSAGGRGEQISVSVPSSNSTAQGNLFGAVETLNFAGTNTGGTTALVGANFNVVNSGTGTLSLQRSFLSNTTNNGGGTVTLTEGILINTPVGGSSSVWTNIYGFHVSDMNPTGSNTLTNPPVGLLIDAQSASGGYAIKTSTGIISFALPTVVSGSGDIVCYNSSTGQISYSTTVALCEPSDPRAKIKGRDLVPSDALAKLAAITPGSGVFRPEMALGSDQHVWLYADQVCQMDDRLCVDERSDGMLNYDKVGMIAYAVAGIKALKMADDERDVKIAALEAEIEQLRHRAGN